MEFGVDAGDGGFDLILGEMWTLVVFYEREEITELLIEAGHFCVSLGSAAASRKARGAGNGIQWVGGSSHLSE